MAWTRTTLTGLLAALILCPIGAVAQDPGFQSAIKALEWRNIGPFVGGRGTSVVGHPTEKNVFFGGHGSGGLWKTEDAGQYWVPVGDGQFNYGSIGAIDLFELDPDIMYVGLGEPQMRNDVSYGDGMYLTLDGGETWDHLGLEQARHISKVIIHPENPNVVYVGSMGQAFGPSPERGVFKTENGGVTWEHVLFKSEKAGVIDMVMSPADPETLFAAAWEFERKSWGPKTAGPDSGLWKSTDGGVTWTDITRNEGLPAGVWGRTGLTMSAADPNRVYALVDNETQQGLYRSDDLGETWRFVSGSPNITSRPFYFYHIEADPTDADKLWAPANKMWRSSDGGETWVLEPGGKDDFHHIWIDPEDPDRMIAVHDAGFQVTLTGGRTWSSFEYQNGVQFYRVDTDDQFPYRVYGNSQDENAYSVPSAYFYGGIPVHETDWIGNGETGAAIPNPDDPDIVYSTSTAATFGAAAHFTVNNLKSRTNEARSVWPEVLFGTAASEFAYRFNWITPFFVSPHDSGTIYYAGNVVFRTRDEGMTWEAISPDLTRNLTDKMEVAGAPWMPEYFGQEVYSTIHRMAESPHEQGVIWTGSDDGLVHVTRDGGETWVDVTPPDLPEYAAVYEIDPSPHDPGTVYMAITRIRTANDYAPYLFKTSDYGETWERIDESFPEGEITRTIREDTVRPGLLFVGTETGVFVSIDDGGEWRRLNQNMPRVPVYDIEIKNNDVVVASHGRGFWIMDEIGPLREYAPELAEKTSYLFNVADHTRFGYNWWIDYGGGPASDKKYYFVRHVEPGMTFYERGSINGERVREYINAGAADPRGVTIDYLLRDDARSVSLEILDADGNLVRAFTQEEIPTERFLSFDNRGYEQELVTGKPAPTVSLGLNRFYWDMRYENVPGVPGLPPTLLNPIAAPGTYLVRLTVDGVPSIKSFELKINPNEPYTREQTDAKDAFWLKLYGETRTTIEAILAGQAAQAEVAEILEADVSEEVRAQGMVVDELAQAFTASMVPTGATLVELISEPTTPIALLTAMHGMLESGEGPPNNQMLTVYDKVTAEIDEARAAFLAELETEMTRFRALIDN